MSGCISVGIPAKSGVGGGILGVLPGVGGLATFSPRLDKHGNSVRGVKVFEELSARFAPPPVRPRASVAASGDAIDVTHGGQTQCDGPGWKIGHPISVDHRSATGVSRKLVR